MRGKGGDLRIFTQNSERSHQRLRITYDVESAAHALYGWDRTQWLILPPIERAFRRIWNGKIRNNFQSYNKNNNMAEREGFEPSMGDAHTPLAGERLQPLGHLSAAAARSTLSGTDRFKRQPESTAHSIILLNFNAGYGFKSALSMRQGRSCSGLIASEAAE